MSNINNIGFGVMLGGLTTMVLGLIFIPNSGIEILVAIPVIMVGSILYNTKEND